MNYAPHFHGPVELVVIGENNVVIRLETGEQRTVPFLAPPRPLHTLIGRDRVLTDLKRSLFSGTPTALRGIPGVGKTSLILSLAYDKEVLSRFQDGVLWCGLGRHGDAMGALGRWGLAAGISPQDIAAADSIDLRAKLVHGAIGMRKMLLVADDIWDAQTALAFRIGGPNCAQIITTRLQHIAEAFAGPDFCQLEELVGDSATDLLARYVPELVEMDPAKARLTIEAVGGLPMAIVLVGSYLRSRARAGQNELQDALGYISQAAGRLTLSQQQGPAEEYPSLPPLAKLSLESVIGISYEALPLRQQIALRALSLFPAKPNSFSQEAGLVVANTQPSDLEALVDASLVEMDGGHRCRLHQTIFDYVAVRGPRDEARSRLVSYYTAFVQRQDINYQKIDTEFQNLQASLHTALAIDHQQEYLSQVVSIYPYLDSRGLYSLAEHLLKTASTLLPVREDPKIRPQLLLRLGQTLHRKGQLAESESVLTQASECEVFGDLSLFGEIFDELGYVQEKLGRYEQAESNLHTSIAFAERCQDANCLAMALSHAGWVALSRGAYEQASHRLESALELVAAKSNPEVLSSVLIHLGWTLIKLGRFEDAEKVLEQGYTAAESINFRERMAAVRLNQGVAAEKMGRYGRAEQFATEALEIAQKIQHREKISAALTNLGLIAEYRGHYTTAEQQYSKALEIARQLGYKERICNLLQNLGSISEFRGNFTKAQSFNGEALQIAREIGHLERVCSLLEERGSIELHMGDLDTAQRFLGEGLQIARNLGHSERQCAILRHLAELALLRGDPSAAQEIIDESSEIATGLHHEWQKSRSYVVRGEILLARGFTVEATDSFRKALRISRIIRSQPTTAEALLGLSRCRAKTGANKLARLEACASLRIFTAIEHYRATAASQWLTELD